MSESTDYWKTYYQDQRVVGGQDLQRNVGRTHAGESITVEVWMRTVNYIAGVVDLAPEHEILEVCCGNGLLVGNLAPACRHAAGVDFSPALLAQLKESFSDTVTVYEADVLNFEWRGGALDAIIVYFALQHFSERDAVKLIARCSSWLKCGGKLFVGDVPDARKQWEYIAAPAHRRDYIQRLLAGTPKIGTWYHPEFFDAVSHYIGGLKTEVRVQPEYQINSSYRFDVVMTKNSNNV
jgi:cyclopropane fatty-acyl-phospholipid synthase-like methyltransferase